MTTFLIIGSLVGVTIGIFHGWHIYRQGLSDSAHELAHRPVAARFTPAYHAIWAVVLWGLFGSYVLFFWIAFAIAHVICKAVSPARTAETST